VKINTVPVEAYRQIGKTEAGKNRSPQEKFDLNRSGSSEKITLPGTNDARAEGVRAKEAPSLLEGVLSPDEKDALVKHFARFGDNGNESPIYERGRQPGRQVGTGIRLDVKA